MADLASLCMQHITHYMIPKALLLCLRVNHYLSLVVAENPLEVHREYKRQTQVRSDFPSYPKL